MKFWDFQWSGQTGENIEIEPVDQSYFLLLLTYLMVTYNVPLPPVVDMLDGYAADFVLLGSRATLQVDTWSFSLRFECKAVRDTVFADLQALPDDYFSRTL